MKLTAIGGFDSGAALAMLRNHLTAGLDVLSGNTYQRNLVVLDQLRQIQLRLEDDGVAVDVDSDDPGVRAEAERLCRWWFDLDTDLAVVDSVLGEHWCHPQARPVRYLDPFEAMVMIVLGQQVSLSAGRTFAGRFLAGYADSEHAGLAVFPTARSVVSDSPAELRDRIGLTRARAETLHAVATAFADGLTPTRESLSAIRGIGPWSVEVAAMRALGDQDAWPATDLVLRRALADRDPNRWSPWRSHATARLWAEMVN